MSYAGGTSKALARRQRNPEFAAHYFVGDGIDVGGGHDTLHVHDWPNMRDCRVWDLGDGDGQFLASVPDDHYDFLYSSHCLEHLHNPYEGMRNWLRVVKPGGYLVVMVPDEDMYEQGVFPSTFNSDHKKTFTASSKPSWSPVSVNVWTLILHLGSAVEVIKVETLHHGYEWGATRRFDQTSTEGECAIEFILRKRLPIEHQQGGRFPAVP